MKNTNNLNNLLSIMLLYLAPGYITYNSDKFCSFIVEDLVGYQKGGLLALLLILIVFLGIWLISLGLTACVIYICNSVLKKIEQI